MMTDGLATSESSLPSVNPSELNPDWFCAYDIITWHLDKTLTGLKLPPLWMIIHGEGGMGKSWVIQTMMENFTSKSSKYLLLKAVYMGVAASLINGKTTHVIGMISTTGHPMNDEVKAKLQQFWRYPTSSLMRYLWYQNHSWLFSLGISA